MITRLTSLTLTLALFTGACTDDKNATDGDTTGSEPTSTTDSEPTSTTVDAATSTTGTGSEPGDTGSEPGDTGSEPGDTGSEPGDTGSEPGTTGEVPPEILPQCEVICDQAVTCGLAPENDGCAAGCSEQYASDTAECADLASTYLDCLAGLSCEQLFDDSICAGAGAAWTAACNNLDICGIAYGGSPDECSLEIDCTEQPLRKMTCDTESCTCFVGDQQTGTCAAEAICDDLEGLAQKGEACCQF